MPRPKNENWYIVLELDFDPAENNESVIQKRIDEKKDFWNRNANHFKYGKQYCVWRDAVPKMKKDMIGPDNIRKELAQEACELTYGEIDETLRMVGLKGNITDSEVAKLASTQKTTEAVIRKRAAFLKIAVVADTEPEFNAKEVYDEYYTKVPAAANSFRTLPNLLSAMGNNDLYDFLFGQGTKSNKLPAATLKARAIEKRKKFTHHDQKTANGQQLCGLCEKAFDSEKSKKDYDEYLMYLSRKKILDSMKKIASFAGNSLAEAQFDEFVNQLTALHRDADLAKDIVTAFCEIEGIKFISKPDPNKKSKKKCRCGLYNDSTRSVCYQCGLPLEITCPECGKTNPSYIAFCDCGFDMNNIDRSDELCNIASDDIKKMSIDAAELHLSQAESLWKGNPRIKQLRKDLSKYGDAFKKEQKKLNDFLNNKEFFAADTIFSGLKRTYGYRETSIETRIRDAKAEAERLFKLAKAESDKEKSLNLCNSAFNACKDYPGLKDYISLKFAPEVPTGLKVVCDTSRKQNVISWTAKDKSADIRYKVIKKLNSSPANINDGTDVAVVSMCSVTDNNIKAGEAYFYAVFAERSGTYSKSGLTAREPAINLFEVSGLSVALGDGSLELVWGTLPNNTVIHIFRYEPNGTTREIKSLDYHHTNYVVSGLANGTKYKFKLCLEYLINGKSIKTNGVEISGIPIQPPKPVETMSVQFEKDDTFAITWNHIGNGEVRFYRSAAAPKYKLGDTVSLSEIERQMSQLMIIKQPRTTDMTSDANKATFKFESKEKFFVSAVTVESGAAVFGAAVQAAKVGTVSINRTVVIAGQLYIYISIPDKAAGFEVLYSADHQPSSLNDDTCDVKHIKIKEYLAKGALVIPYAKSPKYYISVSAEFEDDGNKTYSPLVNYVFNNSAKQQIKYSITLKKGIIRGKSVEISFTMPNGKSSFPDIDFVCTRNRVAMTYDSKNVIAGLRNNGGTVDEMNLKKGSVKISNVNNGITVKIPVPKESDLYIKPFIVGNSSSASVLFKETGDFKIS